MHAYAIQRHLTIKFKLFHLIAKSYSQATHQIRLLTLQIYCITLYVSKTDKSRSNICSQH